MNDNDAAASDQFQRARLPKSREVSSRFLSSHQKSKPSSLNHRKLHSQEDSIFIERLWPSTTSSSKRFETLADHLGNDRLKDQNSTSSNAPLNKQKSSTEFSRFKPEKCAKENDDRSIIGGSLRYTGRLNFQEKSVSSSSSKVPIQTSDSGRLSVEDNALFERFSRRRSENFKNSIELESDFNDNCCRTDFVSRKTSTTNSRKLGIVVSSKYMNDIQRRPQRGYSDSNIQIPVSFESSPTVKKNPLKNAFQRASSLSRHGSSMSQWALSPGRSGSPPMSVENKEKPMSFSSLRPAGTHSKPTGMEKLLNLGLDLFKGKKASVSSPIRPGIADNVHQLMMLHNRLIQWRFVNARAHVVDGNLTSLAEIGLLGTWSGIVKLQQSVLQKKLQLQKEKLEFKLNYVLHSQLKPLEAWGDMERRHLTALSTTKEFLHSVICRVPLTEGAKIDAQEISMALRHASDLAVSIKSVLAIFTPRAKETASLLSDIAKVTTQEKLFLEESFELQRTISALEMEERSLKCGIVQMTMRLQQQSEEASINH